MIPKFTQEQSIIITGFTGIMACKDFSLFHADLERRLGHRVLTHELASDKMEALIKETYRSDFLSLIPTKD